MKQNVLLTIVLIAAISCVTFNNSVFAEEGMDGEDTVLIKLLKDVKTNLQKINQEIEAKKEKQRLERERKEEMLY